MESPVLEICLDESDFLLDALDAAIQDDVSSTMTAPDKLPETPEAESPPINPPASVKPPTRKRVTFSINHRRPLKNSRMTSPKPSTPSSSSGRPGTPGDARPEAPSANSYLSKPSFVAIHLLVQKWPLCWRCGYPGHSRESCYLPPRLFLFQVWPSRHHVQGLSMPYQPECHTTNAPSANAQETRSTCPQLRIQRDTMLPVPTFIF